MAKQAVVHFSDGTRIICGVKNGVIALGEQEITCKRCIRLLRKCQVEESKVIESETQEHAVAADEDPNAIHFSDGEKAICNARSGVALTDAQQVTCKKCQGLLAKKAEAKGDPLVKVRVKNQDLNDGVDFTFTFEGRAFRLINNGVHNLPRSVIEHLELLSYPYKTYVPGQESGQSMQVTGKRFRFAITEM